MRNETNRVPRGTGALSSLVLAWSSCSPVCDVCGYIVQNVTFKLDKVTDSLTRIAEELAEAGVIEASDCGQVAKHMDLLLKNPTVMSGTFPLHAVASRLPDGCDGTAPQEALRQGYVHATIVAVADGVADGADVNQADDDGRTPLFVAAREGHETVVRFLITEAGADVNKTRRGGFTPLYVAAQDGHVGVVRLLVKEGGVDPCSTLTDDGVDVLCVDFDINVSGMHPARFRSTLLLYHPHRGTCFSAVLGKFATLIGLLLAFFVDGVR